MFEKLKNIGKKKEPHLVKLWFNIDDRIRFSLLASANMILRYFLFMFLCIIMTKLHYQINVALTWFLSSFIAYFSYKILVFRTKGNYVKEYSKSLVTWGISYIINAIFLFMFVELLSINILLAQAIAIVAIIVIDYFLFKYFAFKKKELTRRERIILFFTVFADKTIGKFKRKK